VIVPETSVKWVAKPLTFTTVLLRKRALAVSTF